MKTIVTLCGSDWNQWPSLVRTRALDLYHTEEGVEFWDAVNRPTNDSVVWGDWPRHATLGGPAIMAEFEEHIGRLRRQERLALLMIYPSPASLREETGTPPDRARPPSRDDLLGLYKRTLAARPALALQVLRMAIFNQPPAAEDEASARALIADRVFDCVFFLTDDQGGTDNDVLRRRFCALRILIDIARDGRSGDTDSGHDGGVGGDLWSNMLRQMPARSPTAYIMRVPAEMPNPDPSARRSVEIATYFERHTHERGQDSGGQALKDLQGVREEIVSTIAAMRQAILVPTTMAQNEYGRLEAKRETMAGERLLIGEHEPDKPNQTDVDRWRQSIFDSLATFFNERRGQIREAQARTDSNSRRSEQDIDDRMHSTISAHETGLTRNAYAQVMAMLRELREAIIELAPACANRRDEIFEMVRREARTDPDSNGAGADRITAMPRYVELVAMHQDFRVTTVNTIRLRRYAFGVIAPFAMMHLFLAVQTHASPDHPTLWESLLLGFSNVKLGLVAGGFALCAFLAQHIYRDSLARWRRQRTEIIARSEDIARQLHLVAEASARYGETAIKMSGLALIEQKLTDLAKEINEPRILTTINMLRPAGPYEPLSDTEERAFNNALAGRLTETPVNEWLQVMLDRASPEPMTRVRLMFDAADRSGELSVMSRLGIDEPVLISRAAR